jgi:YbbR domain-containing protein
MVNRLRENLLLKIISLVAAIFLYIYVEAERNPTITHTLIAPVIRLNPPPDLEVESDQQRIEISVTGPRAIVDRLKDNDIHALADLQNVRANPSRLATVRLTYSLPTLPSDMAQQLLFDPPSPMFRMRVYQQLTRRLPVDALYPKDPPQGFHYGHAQVTPPRVTVSGREDRVKSVARLVINAEPSEPNAAIDGDFNVSARDSDNNTVEGVKLQPDTVHLKVPLVEEPPSKVVPVSPSIPDLPMPPYTLDKVSVTPNKVKIAGRPERLDQISTLTTEDISVRDMTQDQDVDANLIKPADIDLRDLSGNPIQRVKVRLYIRKPARNSGTPPAPAPDSNAPSSGDGQP